MRVRIHAEQVRSSPIRQTQPTVIESLVEQIEGRFAELERQMSDPSVIADQARYAEVGREYGRLRTAQGLAVEWRTLRDDLEGARELIDSDGEDLSFAPF